MPLAGISYFYAENRHALFAEWKTDMLAAVSEFLGTITFLLLGLGGVQAAASSNAAALAAASNQSSNGGSNSINKVASIEQLLFISASMGLSLLVSAWMFFRVTGAVFNPNVSLSLFLVGVIGPVRFVFYCIAQFVGAIVASAILEGLLPGPLAVTPALGAGTNKAQGVFIEMFLTAALILSVAMLAAEKHSSTMLAPIGIGLTLFAGHLVGVVYTGAAMNTARAFGPAVITGFDSDQWIYWLGPTLGSLLATAVYVFLKYIKYWRLNPGGDTADYKQSPGVFADPELNPNEEDHNILRTGSMMPEIPEEEGSQNGGDGEGGLTREESRQSRQSSQRRSKEPDLEKGLGNGHAMDEKNGLATDEKTDHIHTPSGSPSP